MIVRTNGRAMVTKYGCNFTRRNYGSVYNERRVKSSSFVDLKQIYVIRNIFWLKKVAMFGTMIQSNYIISL